MKLVATVQLVPSAAQKESLLATLQRCNEACEWLGAQAFAVKTRDKVRLQREFYRALRAKFDLSAQMAVLTISKVCEAYKKDKKVQPHFAPLGSMPYDQRIYTFKNGLDRLSIQTLEGRITVPTLIGKYHRARLEGVRGQADLVYRGGALYLFVTVDVPDGTPFDPTDTLGGDLGIRNLLTDSDGQSFSGAPVEKVRQKQAKLRAALQAKGTRSAKKHLKKLSGKERRFRTNENHCISKAFVKKAKDTSRQIGLENLIGIVQRTTVRKEQRAMHLSWAFHQLKVFIAYKSILMGVRVIEVNPRNTSRECPLCHHTDKANRKTQAEFCCVKCGYKAHADLVGAINIARRAETISPVAISKGRSVNAPIVPRTTSEPKQLTFLDTSGYRSGASLALRAGSLTERASLCLRLETTDSRILAPAAPPSPAVCCL